MHAPGRYANLRRIQSLDPEVDHDEILRLTARFEFPWDYSQGTGIAFMRDYGIPSIAELLDRTREFEDHGIKRYDDTILIGDEATLDGIDSPRSHAALRRLNRIHGHYDIPQDELAYVLATTIVGDEDRVVVALDAVVLELTCAVEQRGDGRDAVVAHERDARPLDVVPRELEACGQPEDLVVVHLRVQRLDPVEVGEAAWEVHVVRTPIP